MPDIDLKTIQKAHFIDTPKNSKAIYGAGRLTSQ